MEYKGELKGFPEAIVNRMLDCQEEQGNKRDVTVFEKDKCESKPYGGFNWEETVEEGNFWHRVIMERKFDLFFKLYPNEEYLQSRIKTLKEELAELEKQLEQIKNNTQ